ncbi:carbamoyl phosphate synthase small subunit [Pseudalkalibacillus berkeleyi]|uniref:Carbamoyl phosphate synthase small chain n=1 Tax=Pseudalkalibacillus berkeleyi TaxID=1069813 RepID=A0ABS9GZG3_9BACL|nr:carbamoyl phosphate synthase small subunit [Pseudalkalibacillus berkeleyi]MCF6137039.1 carbamoyl phosphate synthase small subunit [Pseudalkalibacillus berkeleyi]
MKRQLILEDGSIFEGTAIGSMRDTRGEVVFTTGMTGYQETLSDPSYCDQIITFTYPLIGNYGINHEDFESIEPALAGIIVSEATSEPSHWQSNSTIDELLRVKDIPGLSGIDTRALTRKIRTHGTLKGMMCSLDVNIDEVIEELNRTSLPTNQVHKVSTTTPYTLPGRGKRVVLVDFGAKRGILRELIERGCNVTVVPYHISSEEILRLQPDGVMLSNGPGDPTDVPEAIHMVEDILGKVPIFGICLGHQLLGLACGASTVKMKFGHRGVNHPVKDLETEKVMITSQNHGYTVEPNGLEALGLKVTHTAINDGTIEGYRHKEYPAFSVQFHPEASPGPTDSNDLFEQFMMLMSTSKKAGNVLCQNV